MKKILKIAAYPILGCLMFILGMYVGRYNISEKYIDMGRHYAIKEVGDFFYKEIEENFGYITQYDNDYEVIGGINYKTTSLPIILENGVKTIRAYKYVYTLGVDTLHGQNIDHEIYWRTIAKSSNIYSINSSYIKNIINNSVMNNYAEITAPVLKTLKGDLKEEMILRMYMNKENYDYISSLPDNLEIVIFLQKLYNRWGPAYGSEYNYYIANNINNSIIVSNDNIINYVINEIAFQDQIINEQLYRNFVINNRMNNDIRSTINNLTNRIMQQNSFNSLQSHGIDAVPYIILLLDDFRELPIKSISLRNNAPDAFEGMRHYGPHLVVDALAAILNQITGEHYGFIYNGNDTTDNERRQTIKGWRIYLYYLTNAS